MTRYNEPVAKLLKIGEVEPGEDWPDYVKQWKLDKNHIPDLIQMVIDPALNQLDPEDDAVWSSLHAWRALGQLQATEAIEPMLKHLDVFDSGGWPADELPVVFGKMGPAAIPDLVEQLADETLTISARILAGDGLERVGRMHFSSREECVSLLSQQLEHYQQQDRELNSRLIWALLGMEAHEALPLIRLVFAKRRTAPMLISWSDVTRELELKSGCSPVRMLFNWLLPSDS